MNPTADLSVMMPTFNHARYLRRALDAIVTQSVQPKELIVIDDCSTDETPAILAEYARHYPVVRAYRNDPNLGVNRSVHRAFGMATGKYVFFPGSDDYILPGFIEKSMAALERHPEAGLCCSYHSTVDGVTGEIHENASRWCERPTYFPTLAAEQLLGRGNIAGHTAILKREAVAAAGVYLPELEWYADLFLNQVVAFRHGFCHVPEMLSMLTVMPGTYSSSAPRDDRQIKVLGALLTRLGSPEFADIAPSFRRSGCLRCYGSPLLRAAAARPDVWSPDVLGLLSGLEAGCYRDLTGDPDPIVRELAQFFWSPCVRDLVRQVDVRDESTRQLQESNRQLQEEVRRRHETISELCERIQMLDSTVEKAQARIVAMESTWFWKLRTLAARCKHAIFGFFSGRRNRSQ